MDRPLVFFDTECATASGPPHLIELGAVRVVEGEATEHFERLVRPLVPVDPDLQALHGLGDRDLADAQEAVDVLPEFAAWIADDWLVAHNARADLAVLGFEYARRELEPPANPVLDSLALARRTLVEAPDHRLDTLVEHLELEISGVHRALPDATACWKVVEACAERLGGWAQTSSVRLLELAGVSRTIANSTPTRPHRRPAQLRQLERARREDHAVTLVYGGEGETPARLSVLPRLVYQQQKRGYLEGECLRSGLLKTYRLDRILRIEC